MTAENEEVVNEVDESPVDAALSETEGVAEEAPPEAPEYNPNYSYKVLDEEREFPEWMRSAITNEEAEKQAREIFQKADGIPHIKSRRDELEQKVRDYEEKWGPVVQQAQSFYDLKQKKDYESLFEQQGLTDDDIFEYASRRLELRQNPERLAQHEQSRQLQMQNQQLQMQQQSYQEQQAELAAQRRAWELDMELQKPDFAAAVQDFDTRMGQSGAFRNEVITRGQAYAARGQDITPDRAVQEVLRLTGWSPQANNADRTVSADRATPPTLPNIKGKGTSPAKAVPKSTDELRALSRRLKLG